MRAKVSIEAEGLAAEIEKELARDVTASVREGTETLKVLLRGATEQAFKGNRLPKAWRGKVYPQGQNSVDAAGVVSVRGKAAEIIETALKATVIRARGGRWLAIPTEAAGKFGLKRGANGMGATVNKRGARERITPSGFERRTGMKLRFVYEGGKKGGRRAFLIADQAMLGPGRVARPYRTKGRGSRLYGPAGQSFVVFILVPQITTQKRMDLDLIAEQVGAKTAGLISITRSR
ncbi:DUF6441 family protein [Brevundimonas diminuta]|uniref:Uncharacterized protein n=1 Tax=Brevundimonas diminuta TaxID=293 RepID=A0A410NTR1_BREDI|nr:DUF6441 family protein [Brevundimonas diminuta]QAT13280.1 hypothetical protein EQG53_02300 [Brevundimonas diminuta]QQB89364.1 hypothetical protein I6H83_02660 [Brevundimonas diminuta]GEC01657.1 hypothetical protein BDI01nite_27210 [Brevundimonas diminuta]